MTRTNECGAWQKRWWAIIATEALGIPLDFPALLAPIASMALSTIAKVLSFARAAQLTVSSVHFGTVRCLFSALVSADSVSATLFYVSSTRSSLSITWFRIGLSGLHSRGLNSALGLEPRLHRPGLHSGRHSGRHFGLNLVFLPTLLSALWLEPRLHSSLDLISTITLRRCSTPLLASEATTALSTLRSSVAQSARVQHTSLGCITLSSGAAYSARVQHTPLGPLVGCM